MPIKNLNVYCTCTLMSISAMNYCDLVLLFICTFHCTHVDNQLKKNKKEHDKEEYLFNSLCKWPGIQGM